MSTTITRSIPEFIRDHIKGRTDPTDVLAQELFEMIPEQEWADLVLRHALPSLIGSSRSTLRARVVPVRLRSKSQPAYVRAKAHERWLREHLVPLDGVGTRKALAACTASDLHVAGEYMFECAAQNQRAGDRYMKLSVLLEQEGKTTVADLPASTVQGVFDDE